MGAFDLTGLSLRQPATPVKASRVRKHIENPFAGTVYRPSLKSRNGVHYLVCRSWAAASKKADVAAFATFKHDLANDAQPKAMANEMAALLLEMFGPGAFRSVVPVACGHSRRPDCLSFRLAGLIAALIDAELVTAFAPRPVDGVSHPKEFRYLPPLRIVSEPVGPVLVVDDAATSGFHMHEAVMALRARGLAAFGAAYIGGQVTADNRHDVGFTAA